MIRVGSFYQIVASEVESIKVDQVNGICPYQLKVMTKTGHEYGISYQDKARRDQEAERIAKEVDRENRDANPSITTVRWIVAEEINKLRPYMRRIEKSVKGEQHERDNPGHTASEL